MSFRTTVELGGKTATGLHIPDHVVDALGAGQRPPVSVTVNGYTYRSTVARMGGRYLVALNAENRAAAGVVAGQEVEVDLVLDSAPREVETPDDLAAALAENDAAGATYDALAYTYRKEWVRWITEAKRPQTRADRLARTVAALQDGRRTR